MGVFALAAKVVGGAAALSGEGQGGGGYQHFLPTLGVLMSKFFTVPTARWSGPIRDNECV